MTPDATTRAAALKIMTNGSATIAEIAELIGISRQAVRMWAQRANINAVANRENYLADLWAKALADRPSQPQFSRPKRRQRQRRP